MRANTKRAFFSCYVCSLLGPVSFVLFIGPNNKGLCVFSSNDVILLLAWGIISFVYFFVCSGVGCDREWELGSNIHSQRRACGLFNFILAVMLYHLIRNWLFYVFMNLFSVLMSNAEHLVPCKVDLLIV